MNCKEIKKHLPLYPEDIGLSIRAEIDKHLQQCAECRAIAERLKIYRSYAGSVEEVEVAGDFEMNVIKKLGAGRKLNRNRQLLMKSALVLSSAAAIIILFLLFWPQDKPWDEAIESGFSLKEENKGKGPAGLIDFNKIDKSFSKMITETGSTIEVREKNPVTGYYDYVIVGVPGSNLSDFIQKFNEASAIPLNIPEESEKKMSITYYKIYFDMINFTAGNFDGNGYADLIVQFISGKNKGKWVIYNNDNNIHFTRYHFPDVGKDETKYLGDHWMLSGDFNGDGPDDIFLYEYSKSRGFSTHMILNEQDNKFREIAESYLKLPVPAKGEFIKIITGDADGSGSDDLIWISTNGKDSFELTVMNNNRSFRPLFIPDVDSCAGIIMGGDMNGDHYFDLCVKYMAGKRGGQTWIYPNAQDYSFAEPYYAGLSFEGDYIIMTADYNGDRLDDLIVKSGGPFIPGDWYVLRNQESGGMIFEKQFQIEFPGTR